LRGLSLITTKLGRIRTWAGIIILPSGLFVWLVADGWCWFVLREKYCWLVADGWFVLSKKYCWLVADKANEQAVRFPATVVVWTSLGPLPRWVPGPTTRWAPGTTRLALHGT
jgi:hypothetical protein